jgi:hypothetical protein
LASAEERTVENQYRWSGVAATVCVIWIGTAACSGSNGEVSAPSSAGANHGQAGAGGTPAIGGNPNLGGGGAVSGGSASIAGAGVGGLPEASDGGASGSGDTPCKLESLHLKVSGGATFDRSAQAEDACAGEVGENKDLTLTFFVNPPELGNTLLVSAIGHGIEPGSKGPFTPAYFSLATTGAIWNISLPDADHPLACSVDLTTFEMVPPSRWRVAGSLSCPSPLSGIGPLGATPITIEDFKFSILFEAAP